MGLEMMSPSEINRRNAIFWADQTRLRDGRLCDPALAAAALETLRDEELREVPIRSRMTLEASLDRAEKQQQLFGARSRIEFEAANKVLAENGRKGGSAPRRLDPLQRLINELVEKKPSTTENDLLKALQRRLDAVKGPFFSIGRSFIEYDDGSGCIKSVPISGLKDRLSRARKRIRSRQALRAN